MKFTTTQIICILLIALSSSAFAAPITFNAKKAKLGIEKSNEVDIRLKTEFKDYQLIELDATEIYKYVSMEPGYADFTLDIEDGPQWNVSIVLNDLRSVDYAGMLYTREGHYKINEKRATTYKGTVNGDEKHQVRISSFEHVFMAMFYDDGKRTHIEPLSNFIRDISTTLFVLYKHEDVLEKGELSCGSDILEVEEELKKMMNESKSAAWTSGCLDLAVEADFEFCTAHGTLTGFLIDAIVNDAELVFVNNFNLQLRIENEGLWHYNFIPAVATAADDPYSSTWAGGGGGVLDEIRLWIDFVDASSGTPIDKDVGFLFTGKDIVGSSGSGVIGVAWVGTTCANPAYSYACSESFHNQTMRWTVFAHELGHNLNAGHSIGGIMNPWYSGATTFVTQSINEINAHLNSNGGCLTCGCGVRIANPLTKATKQEIAIFANQELHYNVRDVKRQFVSHQREINRIFEDKSNERYATIQGQLAELKKQLIKKVTYSFVMGKEALLEEKEVALIDQILEEYTKLTEYKKFSTFISKVRQLLPVMIDKELKQALIAFDRARLADDLPVQPIPQKAFFETSDSPQFQLVQTIQGNSHLDYYLPQSGQLTIQLFDLNGRLVKMIDQVNVEEGQHQHIINTDDLGNGIYILRAIFSNETTNVNYSSKVVTKK